MTRSPAAPEAAKPAQPQIRLDTSELKSSYCNVCNATVTAEEVVLNFGLNQSWERQDGDYLVSLQHRIILSPFAARRLHQILTELLDKGTAAAGASAAGTAAAPQGGTQADSGSGPQKGPAAGPADGTA